MSVSLEAGRWLFLEEVGTRRLFAVLGRIRWIAAGNSVCNSRPFRLLPFGWRRVTYYQEPQPPCEALVGYGIMRTDVNYVASKVH